MKLLWFDLNSSYAHASLALPALHAQSLVDAPAVAVEWQIVSATVNEQIGTLVAAICNEQPNVVAASCWLFNHEVLLQVLARVKVLLPEVIVVLGGPEFLGENEAFLRRNPFVSALFRGEGEHAFSHWLRCYTQPQQWGEVEGLCFLTKGRDYIDGGMARVCDFDQLVPPEQSRFFNWEKPFIQLETTRGCFNTCAFCVSGGDKPVRMLSVAAIADRLAAIASRGNRHIRLLDRTFNYNFARAKQLLALFRTYTGTLSFHLELHPALLSPELKAELLQMPTGVLHLEAGIQSLQDEVLTTSQRAGGVAPSLDGLRFLASLNNMETHADLIAGLPHYTLTQIEADILTLAEIGVDEIQLESLKLLPGTQMRNAATALGIKHAPYPPYEVLETAAISAAQLQVSHRLSRLLDNFYNTPQWQGVTRYLLLHHSDALSLLLGYLAQQGVATAPLSLERRGMLLYQFCQTHFPSLLSLVEVAWIEAGLPLTKGAAARVRTRQRPHHQQWQVQYGVYSPELRFCYLPATDSTAGGYWFGFAPDTRERKPIFKAIELI